MGLLSTIHPAAGDIIKWQLPGQIRIQTWSLGSAFSSSSAWIPMSYPVIGVFGGNHMELGNPWAHPGPFLMLEMCTWRSEKRSDLLTVPQRWGVGVGARELYAHSTLVPRHLLLGRPHWGVNPDPGPPPPIYSSPTTRGREASSQRFGQQPCPEALRRSLSSLRFRCRKLSHAISPWASLHRHLSHIYIPFMLLLVYLVT